DLILKEHICVLYAEYICLVMAVHIDIHMAVRGTSVFYGEDLTADVQLRSERKSRNRNGTSLRGLGSRCGRAAGPLAAADRAVAVSSQFKFAEILTVGLHIILSGIDRNDTWIFLNNSHRISGGTAVVVIGNNDSRFFTAGMDDLSVSH